MIGRNCVLFIQWRFGDLFPAAPGFDEHFAVKAYTYVHHILDHSPEKLFPDSSILDLVEQG